VFSAPDGYGLCGLVGDGCIVELTNLTSTRMSGLYLARIDRDGFGGGAAINCGGPEVRSASRAGSARSRRSPRRLRTGDGGVRAHLVGGRVIDPAAVHDGDASVPFADRGPDSAPTSTEARAGAVSHPPTSAGTSKFEGSSHCWIARQGRRRRLGLGVSNRIGARRRERRSGG